MNMTFDQRQGILIKARRKQVSLTQDELGKALDLTSQQVANYELGKSTVSSNVLNQIATALGCKMQDLLPDMNNGQAVVLTDKTFDHIISKSDTFLGKVVSICSNIKDKKKQGEIISYLAFISSQSGS